MFDLFWRLYALFYVEPPEIKDGSIVLHAGNVRSADGDVHRISATKVANLHGLDPELCVKAGSIGRQSSAGDLHLYPREDGNYLDLRYFSRNAA